MMRSLKHKLASIVVDSDAAENVCFFTLFTPIISSISVQEYLALQEAKTTQRQKITALAREISHERQRIDKEEKAKAAEAEEQKRKRREVERKHQAAEQELRRKATEEAERKRKAEEEAVRKRKATEEEAKRKQLAEEPKKRGRPKRIEVVPKKNQLVFTFIFFNKSKK
jgi:septal ring factor EnvC (AmiA/AmiB activator)